MVGPREGRGFNRFWGSGKGCFTVGGVVKSCVTVLSEQRPSATALNVLNDVKVDSFRLDETRRLLNQTFRQDGGFGEEVR